MDFDLAALYGVRTKVLNKAVRRNARRFPDDFAFKLTSGEAATLRFQSGTSSPGHGGRRYPPVAFTEEGVAMSSGILSSDRAIDANIVIMRSFVQFQRIALAHEELFRKLAELESRVGRHDDELAELFTAIRGLITTPSPARRRIGFKADQGHSNAGA